jgi:hypothetical protein
MICDLFNLYIKNVLTFINIKNNIKFLFEKLESTIKYATIKRINQ